MDTSLRSLLESTTKEDFPPHQQGGDPPSGGPGFGVPSQPLPQAGASRPQSQQHPRQLGDLPDQADRLWYDQGHRCSLTHT